jgi:DNA-binding CsgD family transcriptional regulator/PAS domain-containing protein
MAGADDLLATIETVHAAGFDAELWPDALAAITRIVGGVGATLEVIDKLNWRHSQFHFVGLPPASELAYLDHYIALNPRVPFALRQKSGDVGWDYMILDEHAMDREPFYTEFLSTMGLRYQVLGILGNTEREFAAFTVQRACGHGHVAQAEIGLMKRLLPHVRQAHDVAARLKGTGAARHSLERALDCLIDGVALVRSDGAIVFANTAFQAIARRADGIKIRRRQIDIAAVEARVRLESAISAVSRRRVSGDPHAPAVADFPVPRSSGESPYVVSVRPLPAKDKIHSQTEAVAIVFVRDLQNGAHAAIALMRQVFGFTESEAGLAQAIQAGIPLGQYAVRQSVSLNTVYTHLRRIKVKTGSSRMVELIRKLNDLQVPLQSK